MNLFGRREPEPTSIDDGREHLIAAARACHAWTEIDRILLVAREGGYFVDAETDEAFVRYRGDAFSPSGAVVSDRVPLYFFVEAGDVVVLERQSQTWSTITYERERAGAL